MQSIINLPWRPLLYASIGTAFLMYAAFMPASVAYATKIVPCEGDACRACDLKTLGANVIHFLVIMAVLLGTLFVMYAGFLMVTAQGNMSKIEHARSIITDLIVGIIILLLSYVIVDTIMKTLTDSSFGSNWSYIQCVSNPTAQKFGEKATSGVSVVPGGTKEPGAVDANGNPLPGTTGSTPGTPATNPDGTPRTNPDGTPATNPDGTPRTNPDGTPVTPDPNAPPGSAAAIAAATAAAQGQSTAAGPGGGNLACAWEVNNILRASGVEPVDGNSVAGMEAALQGGRGTAVDLASAQAGDIIIAPGSMSHVGICQNAGCTSVISNASQGANSSFSWVSGPSFGTNAGPGRIYRVN